MYVHNLDPVIFEITNGIAVRWYGLAYLTGFLVGYLTIYYMAKNKLSQVKPEFAGDLVTYSAIGVLLGGRIGYALFYAPDLFYSFSDSLPYWDLFAVQRGGMASHGGVLGVVLATFLFARKHGISFMHCLDLTVFGGSAGFFFGRIANYINGELYGREAPAGYEWAVRFPNELHQWVRDWYQGMGTSVSDTQRALSQAAVQKLQNLGPAAEALGEITTRTGGKISATAETWQEWVTRGMNSSLSRANVDLYIDKMLFAIQKGNQEVITAIGPALTPRYPSQLYQAVLEGLMVFILLVIIWAKPRRPGVIAGWFGTLYAIARIIGEQYRLPDAHIGYELFHLTRGQWLSIGMVTISLTFFIFAHKRQQPKQGGWLQKKKAPQ